MLENLKLLIKEGKTLDALKELYQKLHNGSEKQQVLQLLNQWERNQEQLQLGSISRSDADITTNRITDALLTIISKLSEKDLKRWVIAGRWGTKLIAILGLMAIGFTAFYWFTQPFKLSVSVVGEDGQHIEQLNGKAYIRIKHTEEMPPALIDHEGIAYFRAIPAQFRHDSVRIGIIRKDGISYEGDSSYVIGSAQSVTLRVRPWLWDVVEGRIRDAHSLSPLAQVHVAYRDIMAVTDTFGYFRLEIPSEKQKQEISLIVVKDGYRTITGKATPQTGEMFEKFMTKMPK